MKITEIKIKSSGLARAVTVELTTTDAEALEGMSAEVDKLVLSAFARALGSASVLMPELGAKADGERVVELAKTYIEVGPENAGVIEPVKRGRKRANPLGPTDAPTPTTTSASAPTATSSSPEPVAEASQRKRRPNPNATPDPTIAPPVASPGLEPTSGTVSGQRRARTDGVPATSPSDKITDMDLGKAASQAALTLTPKGVQAILTTDFGVPHVGKLEGANRRKFLDTLAARVKAGA